MQQEIYRIICEHEDGRKTKSVVGHTNRKIADHFTKQLNRTFPHRHYYVVTEFPTLKQAKV